MDMEIVPKKTKNNKRKAAPVRTYQFISTMPDMTKGQSVNIHVQKVEDVSDYEPDITVIIPGRITEMNAVSAYPPELVEKYRPIKAGKLVTVHCKECNLPWSPNGLNESGFCLYCQWGWNGHNASNV